MTLNNREKLLLTILGIFLFLAVYIQFIFLPQWDSQSQLVKERDDLVQVLNDIDEYLNPQSTPRKEIREVEEMFQKSQFVKDTIGVYSVSEPAAYLLGGELIIRKSKHNGITISISKENYNG